MNKSRILFLVLIIVLFLILALWIKYDFIQNQFNTNIVSNTDISYDVSKKNFYKRMLDGEEKNNQLIGVNINFDFIFYGYHEYDNLFHTDDMSKGIRMEFGSNKSLGFVTTNMDGKLIGCNLSKKIELNKKYNVSIRYVPNKIIIYLNGNEVVNNLTDFEPSFERLVVGYGWKPERFFNGKINNFNIEYIYSNNQYFTQIIVIFLNIVLLLFIIYLVNNIHMYELNFNIKRKNALLFFLLFLFMSISASYTFKTFITFYKYKYEVSKDIELSIPIFIFLFKNELNKTFIDVYTKISQKEDESNLKTFYISVDDNLIKKLNSNLPASGKNQSVDALLKISDENKIRKIKLRYRGEGNYHWFYKQKSLRIKLSKSDVYNMEKKFNLINPPYIYNFRDVANYKIARDMGLIAPDYYPVRVYINNEYYGVYMYLSQVDESLLRKHKVMPGSIYYGDSGNTPINSSGATALWYDAKYWVKKSARNAEQKASRNDINSFISNLHSNNEESFYNYFNNTLNSDKFIKFISLDRITGTSHHDFNHNHKIYVDPYKGKIEPIEWDLREWSNIKIKDHSVYPLLQSVKLNSMLDFEVDKKVYELYNNGIVEKMISYYNTSVLDSKNDLNSDKYKDKAIGVKKLFNSSNGIWFSIPYTYPELLNTMQNDFKLLRERKDYYLKNIINNTSISFQVNNVSKNNYELKYFVGGNTPINISFIKSPINVEIFKTLDGVLTHTTNQEILYPGRKLIENKHRVISFSNKKVVSAIEEYTFVINNITKVELNKMLKDIIYSNAITGEIVSVSNMLNKVDSSVKHPWSYIENKKSSLVLSGNINVDNDIVYNKYTNIIIEKGTVFNMAEGASIYFYGKVEAKGTKNKPIKFIAKDKNKPWGLIAVQGKSTTGSKFEYCEFEDGSLDTKDLINYTAPFNIHDMDWFEVRNCKIGRNYIGDDAMHIAYSKGIVDNCEFINARSDGLDIDISDVHITNNIFYNSGNDGLDIMTTKMNASDNVFIKMGDKGISVGEWSEAVLQNSFFLKTMIGIEIKDKSVVNASNLVFIDSIDKSINLYNKNKRYDKGGFLQANYLYFIGNTKITFDKKSTINLNNKIINILPKLNQFDWFNNLNDNYKKIIEDYGVKNG